MQTNIPALVIAAAVLTTAACTKYEQKSTPTGPTASGLSALLGTWTSTSVLPTPSSCTNFKWNATEQTANSVKGSFTATCPGDLSVTGTGEAVMQNPTTIVWSAQGNATRPGLTSCGIAVTGTAELGVDSIRITYAGDTCLGKVSGVETLKR